MNACENLLTQTTRTHTHTRTAITGLVIYTPNLIQYLALFEHRSEWYCYEKLRN